MSTIRQEIFNSFGDAFIYAIEYKGLNPANFSKKYNVDEGQVSKYVNNKRTPRPDTVKKLGDYLSVEFKKLKNGWGVKDLNRSQNLSDPVQEAIDAVDQVKEEQGRYTASKQFQDDPEKLLQLSQMLIDIYLKQIEKK